MNKSNEPPRASHCWLAVVLYAVAMAWVESAVVLYLRTLSNRLDPYQAGPLPLVAGLARAEVIREAATLLMLATVGWLAGRNFRPRVGYALLAFGVWDICYYVFLKPLTGWPNSLLDWDILFLIPLPWWGPVLAPVLIAALMILFGTLVTQCPAGTQAPWPRWPSLAAFGVGAALALYVFMADAIRLPERTETALRQMLPTQFNWPLFSFALVLMALPVIEVGRRVRPPRVAAGAPGLGESA